jgi:hypothetical protein
MSPLVVTPVSDEFVSAVYSAVRPAFASEDMESLISVTMANQHKLIYYCNPHDDDCEKVHHRFESSIELEDGSYENYYIEFKNTHSSVDDEVYVARADDLD